MGKFNALESRLDIRKGKTNYGGFKTNSSDYYSVKGIIFGTL
jgi:hypothetical protein